MYEEKSLLSMCCLPVYQRQINYDMNGMTFIVPMSQHHRQNMNKLVSQAAAAGHEENVHIFIKLGASINVAFSCAIQNMKHGVCCRILCEYGTSKFDRYRFDQYLKPGHIEDVVLRGDVVLARTIFEHIDNFERFTKISMTWVFKVACKTNNIHMCKLFYSPSQEITARMIHPKATFSFSRFCDYLNLLSPCFRTLLLEKRKHYEDQLQGRITQRFRRKTEQALEVIRWQEIKFKTRALRILVPDILSIVESYLCFLKTDK